MRILRNKLYGGQTLAQIINQVGRGQVPINNAATNYGAGMARTNALAPEAGFGAGQSQINTDQPAGLDVMGKQNLNMPNLSSDGSMAIAGGNTGIKTMAPNGNIGMPSSGGAVQLKQLQNYGLEPKPIGAQLGAGASPSTQPSTWGGKNYDYRANPELDRQMKMKALGAAQGNMYAEGGEVDAADVPVGTGMARTNALAPEAGFDMKQSQLNADQQRLAGVDPNRRTYNPAVLDVMGNQNLNMPQPSLSDIYNQPNRRMQQGTFQNRIPGQQRPRYGY